MLKNLLGILAFCCLSVVAAAQDFAYGQVSQADLDMKFYDKDPSAHAVVLSEYNGVYINNVKPYGLIHYNHSKIKILDAAALNTGNIKIPYYKWDNGKTDLLKNFKAVVYYTDAAGKKQQTEVNQAGGRVAEESKNMMMFTYPLPNVVKGCVIECSYELETMDMKDLTPWLIQADIPKVYSEYQLTLPSTYNFDAKLTGLYPLLKDTITRNTGCYDKDKTKTCYVLTYAMRDIPAFVPEEQMPSPLEYISAVYFQSVRVSNYNLLAGYAIKQYGNWKTIDNLLKTSESFGLQLKESNSLRKKLPKEALALTDTLEKAKAIYHFVNKTVKWNNQINLLTSKDVGKTLTSRTGSSADINLTMIAALRSAGINAEPVLITVKGTELNKKPYPALTNFNYVAGRVIINKNTYLLDGTDPLMPFGLIPSICVNGQGRVISMRDTSYWADLDVPFKKKASSVFVLALQPDGKLKGKVSNYYTGYQAYEMRKVIKSFASTEEYFDKLAEKLPRTKMLSTKILALDSADAPLSEVIELEISLPEHASGEQIAFNPFLFSKITENPFKLEKRLYPLDYGMPSDSRFVLQLTLPEGYKLDNPPAETRIALPEQGGSFISGFNQDGSDLTFSHVIRLNRPAYAAVEYPYLKELFNQVIRTEKADLIIKKIK